MTPVKDQQSCGSCWSFTATAVYESMVAIQKNQDVVRFSEQQVVDCAKDGANGCNGGDYPPAWNWAKQAGGIVAYDEYPYENKDSTCQAKTGVKRFPAPTGVYPNPKGEENIAAELKNGPLAVAVVCNDAFMAYESGIFKGPCSDKFDELNHAVTLVGYKPNSSPGSGDGYWVVRNSWNTGWGEKGFIRMGLGNTCGVEADVKGMRVQ